MLTPRGDLLTISDRGTKVWAFGLSIMTPSPRLKARPSTCGSFAGRLLRNRPREGTLETQEASVRAVFSMTRLTGSVLRLAGSCMHMLSIAKTRIGSDIEQVFLGESEAL